MRHQYKNAYIEKHGKAAYDDKLAKNTQWRAEHPDALARYAKTRSRETGSDKIFFIGDVHLGASTVDTDFIKDLAKRCWSKNPVFLMGDLCDLGLDRGMNWDNKTGPQEQIDLVEEIFKPLNICGYVVGNHENRIFTKVGLTPYKHIFGMLPANEYIVDDMRIFMNHGKSAAENMFSEFQKYVKYIDADVIALGHSHDLANITFLRGGKIQHLVRTGSFLGRSKYVLDAGFAPKIRGWVEYDTVGNKIRLKGLTQDGEVFAL